MSRVVIAGGGIGGLATAIALRDRGHDVTVLERATNLTAIGAGIGLQCNAVRALRALGLADEILDLGVPIERYEYVDTRGRGIAGWPQGDIGRKLGEPTVVVHRAQLQAALLSRLPEAVIRLGARCTGYVEADDGVTVTLEGGETVRGDVLVGADGLRSVVRAQLLGDAEPRHAGWVAWRGIAELGVASFPLGLARQSLGRGRSFGTWHIGGGRIYWVGTLRMAEGAADDPATRKERAAAAFAAFHEPVATVIAATPPDAILSNEIHDRPPVTGWSGRRVVLLGDAAHPTTPVTGQGGGQAIIDAVTLSEELDGAGDLRAESSLAQAFAAYEARRAPTTADITNEAWFISGMHHWDGRLKCRMRDLSLRLTPQRVWWKRMETRLAP
jgi:2-polyprenyl-6-methoxyphenol hydroxylase-like FAD-dependent oxidoreductase